MGILTADMQRVVREQQLGFIATVCPDGTPNLSPKGTTRVWDGDHLVFADICSPGTVANLRANPAIEINVVDPILRKGYRFKGAATVLTEGADFERGRALYGDPADPDPMSTVRRIRALVLVRVERAAPLVSPAYDTGLDEDAIRARWMEHHTRLHSGWASSGART
jgi:predicted pyridoxine 5'-phosphate oxidase superfamily flavin-nucleotide-binding protein